MFFLIVSAKGRFTNFAESKALTVGLLVSPWVLWLIFLIAGLVVSPS